jgi:uncharacterized protein involved in outer membrane biogenesis
MASRLGSSWKIITLLIIVILTLAVFLFFRGPYVSDLLKMVILPEVQAALGRHVVAEKIVLNIFPVYVEAQGFIVFDEEGGPFATSERIKVYPRLSGLFEGRIDIQRIVLMSPSIDGTLEELETISSVVREREGEEPEAAFELGVKTIAVREGRVSLKVEKSGESFSARELNADIALKEKPEIDFSAAFRPCLLPSRVVWSLTVRP